MAEPTIDDYREQNRLHMVWHGELQDALRKYGQHSHPCSRIESAGLVPCSCGWDDLSNRLLARTDASPNKHARTEDE